MKKYIIYTEYKPNLELIIKKYVPGATLIRGCGIYKYMKENMAQITIFNSDFDQIKLLAKNIQQINRQTEVWIEKQNAILFIIK